MEIELNLSLNSLTDDQIFDLLKKEGLDPGPIFNTVRKLYENKFIRFLKEKNEVDRKEILNRLESSKVKKNEESRKLMKQNWYILFRCMNLKVFCFIFFVFIFCIESLNKD